MNWTGYPRTRLLSRTRRIEILEPAVYSALSIYNPILVAPKELAVRLS